MRAGMGWMAGMGVLEGGREGENGREKMGREDWEEARELMRRVGGGSPRQLS